MDNTKEKIMNKLSRVIEEHKNELSNSEYDYEQFCSVLLNVLKIVFENENVDVLFLNTEKTGAAQDIIAINHDCEQTDKMLGADVTKAFLDYTEGVPFINIIKLVIETLLDGISSWQNKVIESIDISVEDIKNCDIENCVILQLINTGMNEEFIASHPTRQFHDLSIYCAIKTELKNGKTKLIPISYDIMNHFNMNEQSLFSRAEKNSIKLVTPIITPLILVPELYGVDSELIFEEFTKEEYNQLKEECINVKIQPYLITSSLQRFSAFLFLYENILKGISEKTETDLYIIPSSIHESIAVLVTEYNSFEDTLAMVYVTNKTQVPKEEILSDSIYYYNRNKGHITHYYRTPFVQ